MKNVTKTTEEIIRDLQEANGMLEIEIDKLTEALKEAESCIEALQSELSYVHSGEPSYGW